MLEHFELNEYFDVIEGSDVNFPRMTKSDVIEIALKKLGFFEAEKRKGVVMIGDRKYDVAGATRLGLIVLESLMDMAEQKN